MKVLKVFILLVLVVSVQLQTPPVPTDFSENKIGGHFRQCLVDSIKEILAFIQLVQDIRSFNWRGAIADLKRIIQRTHDLMTDCKGIICFGTGYKYCIQDHPGQACEQWGLFVYPKCKPGFTNWDCCVCATICPPGFRDDGLYCAKPSAYGRGAGYPLWKKDKCNQEHEDVGGCEKNGALYYPKCKPNFHNVGCCICSPDCPSGWNDIGVSCKKPQSYGRGTGYSVLFSICRNNEHLEIPTIPSSSCTDQATKLDTLLNYLDSEIRKGEQDKTY